MADSNSPVRLTVFGSGAVGSNLAAHLCAVPRFEVSVVARGEHLRAIRNEGLELRSEGRRFHCTPRATDDASTLPPQDIVFVTLKAHSVPPMADQIARLMGPTGLAVFFVNGLPWWMEPEPDARLAPIDRERVIGGVVYSSNEIKRPGHVAHDGGDRWAVGEPRGGSSERIERIAALIAQAGLNGVAQPELRQEIWIKLLYNASVNPVAALTRLDCAQLSPVRALNRIGMQIRLEIAAAAASDGIDLSGHPALADWDDMKLSTPVKPSMLQDVLAGRGMEVDAIVDAPRRVAARAGIPTPTLDVVSGLVGGLDESLRVN